MTNSLIIPVWNGAAVIGDCLEAICTLADKPDEIIAVDNASTDDSVNIIAQSYPQVNLLKQSANLGFAGGVNIGLQAARGDILILLNQDCMVQSGWLRALLETFTTYPSFGVLGCTILNPDGSIDHAGATLTAPSAYGKHLTTINDTQPQKAEYVTGAVLAIQRQVLKSVGLFDEGFYPAYYEESDYCYRVRYHGFEVGFVPQAQAVHLRSSREWQADPIKHTANQHRSRYRFISKHFSTEQISQFFKAEYTALENEPYFEQLVGRMLGARDTLRDLPNIVHRRQTDLKNSSSIEQQRQLQVGFTQLFQLSFQAAEQLGLAHLQPPPLEDWQVYNAQIRDTFEQAYQNLGQLSQTFIQAQTKLNSSKTNTTLLPNNQQRLSIETTQQKIAELQQEEKELLNKIFFTPSTQTDSRWQRLLRLGIKRPLSIFSGREYRLTMKLNTLQTLRVNYLTNLTRLQGEQLNQTRIKIHEQLNQTRIKIHEQLNQTRIKIHEQLNQTRVQLGELVEPLALWQRENRAQIDWLHDYRQQQIEQRFKLLEILTKYEYR